MHTCIYIPEELTGTRLREHEHNHVMLAVEYACEWWGFQGKNDIELLHRKFSKMVLNVPPSATNVAVYGELGRMPMYLRREVLMI